MYRTLDYGKIFQGNNQVPEKSLFLISQTKTQLHFFKELLNFSL
jgi:hypothetical protein